MSERKDYLERFYVSERIIFANRLKCLRIAHGLSTSQLAILLNFKSKGSIGNLESGRSMPLFNNLLCIANLFAVSLDWLTNRGEGGPYHNFILLSMEEKYLRRIKDTKNRMASYLNGK